MALETFTTLYEFLVRFDINGEFQAAHVINRRRIVLDGETIQDTLLPATAVPLEGIPDVLDGATAALIAENAELRARIAELENPAAAALDADAGEPADPE